MVRAESHEAMWPHPVRNDHEFPRIIYHYNYNSGYASGTKDVVRAQKRLWKVAWEIMNLEVSGGKKRSCKISDIHKIDNNMMGYKCIAIEKCMKWKSLKYDWCLSQSGRIYYGFYIFS